MVRTALTMKSGWGQRHHVRRSVHRRDLPVSGVSEALAPVLNGDAIQRATQHHDRERNLRQPEVGSIPAHGDHAAQHRHHARLPVLRQEQRHLPEVFVGCRSYPLGEHARPALGPGVGDWPHQHEPDDAL